MLNFKDNLIFIGTTILVFTVGILLFKAGLWIMTRFTIWYRENNAKRNNKVNKTNKIKRDVNPSNTVVIHQKCTGNGNIMMGQSIVINGNSNVVAVNKSKIVKTSTDKTTKK